MTEEERTLREKLLQRRRRLQAEAAAAERRASAAAEKVAKAAQAQDWLKRGICAELARAAQQFTTAFGEEQLSAGTATHDLALIGEGLDACNVEVRFENEAVGRIETSLDEELTVIVSLTEPNVRTRELGRSPIEVASEVFTSAWFYSELVKVGLRATDEW